MSGIFVALMASGGVVVDLTSPVTITHSSGGILASATGYRVAADGFVYRAASSVSPSYTQFEQWISAPALAGDYEVRVTATGDTPTGSALGTWLALSSTRSWELIASPGGTLTATLTVEIRDTATATVRDTATVTMTSEAV